MARELILIGRIDRIDLTDFGLLDIPAKIDTGAYTSSIHCSNIEVIERKGIPRLRFHILDNDPRHAGQVFETRYFELKFIKSSIGAIEQRYVIQTRVALFDKIYRTKFSLSNRGEMKFPVLIGRKLLRRRFVVDVTKCNVSYKSKTSKIL